jgi:hypothetical protein
MSSRRARIFSSSAITDLDPEESLAHPPSRKRDTVTLARYDLGPDAQDEDDLIEIFCQAAWLGEKRSHDRPAGTGISRTHRHSTADRPDRDGRVQQLRSCDSLHTLLTIS